MPKLGPPITADAEYGNHPMKSTRLLQWATAAVLVITAVFEMHGYWISNPEATCSSAHGDTYLQARACSLAINENELEGKPAASLYAARGEAEETNCDLHDASLDYRRAAALAPESPRADSLAREGADVEGEYCSRGENADRAAAVVIYNGLLALPYALGGLAIVFGLYWLTNKLFLSALLLTLSGVSWLLALLAVVVALSTFSWTFADYFPRWLIQEMLFDQRVLTPLWSIVIAGWLTLAGTRTSERHQAVVET